MFRSPFRFTPLGALLALGSFATLAQQPPATVVITGNPLGRDELIQPSNVLAGDGLALRRGGTLGATLDGLPGVAQSGFGPQSARPVIRGLDGDRVRLLDNGGASADASNLSFDHAVAIDPLVIERLEVLRGPAALLYGGNATGGVVNAIDNRVPRRPLERLGGRAEVRFGGAANERAGAAVIEGGAGGLNWHADVAARRSEDLRVPRFRPVFDGEPGEPTRRVINSAGDSNAGAVGVSWADADGYVGAAVDGYRNYYGVAVEPGVTIRMRRQQAQLAGERRSLAGPFAQFEFRLGQTRYRHDEVEGSAEVGTRFHSRGRELRLMARQAAVGRWHGVIGLQAEQLDFSALGDEAFVPDTHSRSAGVFTLQEWRGDALTLAAGARLERSRVRSDGDPAGSEAAQARFGAAAERRFSPRSAALSLQAPLAGGWSASGSLGHTERAPAYYELFANGVHVATGAFERGDPNLATERSRQAELGLAWKRGPHRLQAQAWTARFSNYIALDATGASIEETGEDGAPVAVPGYAFRGIPARLHGIELEGHWRLLEQPWQLDAHGSVDRVRGSDRASGAPLPRLAPWRLMLGLEARQGGWRIGGQARHAARQSRFSPGDVPTPSYTLVDLWASWSMRLGAGDLSWTLKLDNAGDRLAFNASTLRAAREVAPYAGRAVSVGLRWTL
ncbi:TonB-dependent receptor [Aquincola sp. S2]|uniref:TonB-dependent receptor n=1 Tax=Pseudaquabacterium terrae TaxID=2732868 RepID=A0ABX2EL97_9BURK|nr:TonB-dependent receptor [Aquabacterium terrae]NRF69340.1 TonB-dependent receptor [Aquabacterium terrae]